MGIVGGCITLECNMFTERVSVLRSLDKTAHKLIRNMKLPYVSYGLQGYSVYMPEYIMLKILFGSKNIKRLW